MSVELDYDYRAERRREHVLAVWQLWRDLERVSTARPAERRPHMAVSACGIVRELEELTAALDRRLPLVEQARDDAIAREAAALRAKPADRLAELANGCSAQACALPWQDA